MRKGDDDLSRDKTRRRRSKGKSLFLTCIYRLGVNLGCVRKQPMGPKKSGQETQRGDEGVYVCARDGCKWPVPESA